MDSSSDFKKASDMMNYQSSSTEVTTPSIKADEIKESLRKAVIDSYVNGYKELADTWRGLETKAQGGIAIAGIFIAGVFAYIQKVDPNLRSNEKALLAIAVFFLIISVIFSILVLKIRTVAAPPLGGYTDRLVTDLLHYIKEDAELISRRPLLDNDQIDAWRLVEVEVGTSNAHKAHNLWRAQICLMVAILTVALLTILKIFE